MARSTVKSIEKVDDFKYRVESSSGSVYQITCSGSVDLPGHPAEYGLLWDCNCPARGSCHHLKAVIKYRQESEGSEEVEFNPAEEWQNTGRPVTWEEAHTLTIDEQIQISRGPMPPVELCGQLKRSERWCGEPAITPGRCKRHSPKLSTRLEAIREG